MNTVYQEVATTTCENVASGTVCVEYRTNYLFYDHQMLFEGLVLMLAVFAIVIFYFRKL